MNKPKSERKKIKDTTKRTTTRLIKEIAKSEGILAALGDGISILDRTFEILYQNQAEIDMMGTHIGESCFKAYAKRQGICDGCPLVLTFKDGRIHTVQRELHTDKEIRYIEITASPLKDPEGKIIAGIELVRDITERKQIEEKLREEEERYRLLFNNVSDAIIVHEISPNITELDRFRIIEANDIACKYLGYTREELLQMTVPELDDPEVQEKMPPILNTILKEGRATWEGIHIHKDGHRIPVEITNKLFNFSGKLMVLASARDITERKQAEEALRESEARYRSYIEVTGQIAWVTNAAGEVEEDVPSLRRFSGQTYEEAKGSGWAKALHPEDIDRTLKVWQNSVTTRSPYEIEYRMRRHDGVYRDLLARGFPVFNENGSIREWVGTCIDITERKQAEKALQESEKRYEKLIDSITDYLYTVYLKNGQALLTKHGPGCVAVTGYTSEEYAADIHLWYRMVHEKDKETVKKQFENIISGKVIKPIEHRIIHKNGEIKWVRNTVVPRLNEEGVLIAYDGIIENITERKKAEEERDRILNISHDLICIAGMDGYFKYLNPAWEKTLGYKREELMTRPFIDFIHPDDHIKNDAEVEKLAAGYETIDFENRYIHKDGSILDISWTSVPLLEEKLMYCIGRDITERKKVEEEKVILEEQLLQAQKMEAIGQLAGGIAHDFNNILTAIIGFATLLKMDTNEGDILRSYITPILNSAEKATNLIQSLLAFSRRQIISPKLFNLNNIIKGLHALLSRIIGEDIELSTVLSERDLVIMADSGQIEQVLMNLATNARDAMPNGGKLIISTKLVHLDSEFVRAHGFGRLGAYALVSVEDTGKGIDKKTKERIFEPFFTTKEVGKGTGLGLAMVYGIIKQHDGYIDFYSELGIGTRFNIYLPLIKSDIEETNLEGMLFLKGGEETVLVVEDDALVRTLVKEVLERFGYIVLEATDGEDAIRVFHENEDKIQLLILDVIMPKKDGKEVYDVIREIKPDMKAIFISGYDANIIHKKGILDEGLIFISKPILANELLRKVRERLDKKDTR
jgi:PAS domain S-box-containing protein